MESDRSTQNTQDAPRCSVCGSPLKAGSCPRCGDTGGFQWIRRETLLLVLVAVASVPLYLFTREVAIRNRERKALAATYWHQRGQQQLVSGDTEGAIVSFHRSTVNDRENFQYGLELAKALAAGGYPEEARLALLRLRDSAPEDSEINLQLARLVASRGNVREAVRYYRNALYGVWPTETAAPERREVRKELIEFLLERQERTIALSELLLLSSELPLDSGPHIEVAWLFLRADDSQQALAHFLKALELDPKNETALAGAGESSFYLRDYRNARRYLRAALAQQPSLENASQLLEITDLILSRDPLASRLSLPERHRRLDANFTHALQRLESCMERQTESTEAHVSDLQTLHQEARELQPKLQLRSLRRDPGLINEGVDLAYRILQATHRSCGERSNLDQALVRIGERYQGGET
ncbi:MAG: hypothetical protein HY647_03975 [Acidobacteria bacterium]|nr:hypothetical protein [Acidobacteriota bacterium]